MTQRSLAVEPAGPRPALRFSLSEAPERSAASGRPDFGVRAGAAPTPREPPLLGAFADGTVVLLRSIAPDDKARLRQAFERLSPASRQRRFLAPVQHLPDGLLRQFTEIDHIDHVAWVAELPREPGRPLAGVGRWIRSSDDPGVAELAIAVIDAYQGRGLGTTLLALLAESARRRAVSAFRGSVLQDNGAVLALLRAFGAELGLPSRGTREFRLSLASAVAVHRAWTGTIPFHVGRPRGSIAS